MPPCRSINYDDASSTFTYLTTLGQEEFNLPDNCHSINIPKTDQKQKASQQLVAKLSWFTLKDTISGS